MASSDKSFYTPHKEKLKLRVYRRAKYLPSVFYKKVIPREGSYRSEDSGIYASADGRHLVYLHKTPSMYYLVDANDSVTAVSGRFKKWQGPDLRRVCGTRIHMFNELVGDAAGEYGICSLLALAAELWFKTYLVGTPGLSEHVRLNTVCNIFGDESQFEDFSEMDSVTVNYIRTGGLDVTRDSRLREVAKAYVTYYDLDGSKTELFK